MVTAVFLSWAAWVLAISPPSAKAVLPTLETCVSICDCPVEEQARMTSKRTSRGVIRDLGERMNSVYNNPACGANARFPPDGVLFMYNYLVTHI